MAIKFLFDGGAYKSNTDDGRIREPLTDIESQLVMVDPELPGDTDNSVGTTLNMSRYAKYLSDLAVGDELIVGLVPDATLLRGLWFGSFDAVDGFTVTADLVSVRDIYTAVEAQGTDVPSGVVSLPGTAALDYDFTDGLGHATQDAYDLAKIYGGTLSDYRNEAALRYANFPDPVFAGLGVSTYLRLTVTALGEFGNNTDGGCCSTCGDLAFPTFQVGAIYDVLCFDKQRVRNFCNCGGSPCEGNNGTEPTVS